MKFLIEAVGCLHYVPVSPEGLRMEIDNVSTHHLRNQLSSFMPRTILIRTSFKLLISISVALSTLRLKIDILKYCL